MSEHERATIERALAGLVRTGEALAQFDALYNAVMDALIELRDHGQVSDVTLHRISEGTRRADLDRLAMSVAQMVSALALVMAKVKAS